MNPDFPLTPLEDLDLCPSPCPRGGSFTTNNTSNAAITPRPGVICVEGVFRGGGRGDRVRRGSLK